MIKEKKKKKEISKINLYSSYSQIFELFVPQFTTIIWYGNGTVQIINKAKKNW